MQDLSKYKIKSGRPILEALGMIDRLSEEFTLTLFVVDETEKVIGSVTDGDIRRGLLRGVGLGDPVDDIMARHFTYLCECCFEWEKLKQIKARQYKVVPVLNGRGQIVRIIDFNRAHSYLPVDAVLMAGGKGERLRPMTLSCPKPLLPVGGRPIIDYNIENLLKNGIEHIHVTVNYLHEQIEEHFSVPRANGTMVQCVREPEFLGTIGSVKFVEKWHNNTILVMNSDLFTNIDLEAFFLHFKENNADMSVAAVPYSVSIPYGIFEIDGVRDIKGIKEKPSYHYYANAGIYLIKREILDLIPDRTFFDATDLMELLIGQEKKVIRYPLSGYWIDIGKPEDFKKVQDLAQHINKK